MSSPTPRVSRSAAVWTVAGLVLLALNLRAAITGVSPLLDDLQHALGLSTPAMGVLATLPVLCLGAFAALAPPLARRVGAEAALTGALLLILGGVLLRSAPWPGTLATMALFAGTVMAGAGIAVGNVLMPYVVKSAFPERVGLFTGLAMMLMSTGAALSSGLAVPLNELGGWRMALAVWAIPALIGVSVWAPLAVRRRATPPTASASATRTGTSRPASPESGGTGATFGVPPDGEQPAGMAAPNAAAHAMPHSEGVPDRTAPARAGDLDEPDAAGRGPNEAGQGPGTDLRGLSAAEHGPNEAGRVSGAGLRGLNAAEYGPNEVGRGPGAGVRGLSAAGGGSNEVGRVPGAGVRGLSAAGRDPGEGGRDSSAGSSASDAGGRGPDESRRGRGAGERGAAGDGSVLRSRLAWCVTLFLGMQSLAFYVLMSWLPAIMRDHGYSAATAGLMLSLMMLLGIPTGLVMPVLAARRVDQRPLVVAVMSLMIGGVAGLLLVPGAGWLWAFVLGIGTGTAFPLAFTLITLRSATPRAAARLSGMAQTTGYLLAGTGPFLFGALNGTTGGWNVPLWILLVWLLPETLFALHAARPGVVGTAPARRPVRLEPTGTSPARRTDTLVTVGRTSS